MAWIAWDRLCLTKSRGGLGFRDFNKFNDALLGKQAWRLLTNEDSFMVRVLRGKYFPANSFMEAHLGANPSFTWRSILSARKVLEVGIQKRLGNGQDTSVFKDPWIPGTSTRRIISPSREANGEMRVAELLHEGGRGWNSEKVREMFLPFECDRILKITLSRSGDMVEDAWCWDGERDGNYSVSSAYKLLSNNANELEESLDYNKEMWLWKLIWKCRVLPRIKVLFWQLCHDAIATKHNIARRIKEIDDSCPCCHSRSETSMHVIRDCGWVGGIWEGLGLEVCEDMGFMRVREWVEAVLRDASDSEWETFMVGCWAIWERRNRVVFEGGRWCEEDVLERVKSILWEMREEMHEAVRGYKGGGVSRGGMVQLTESGRGKDSEGGGDSRGWTVQRAELGRERCREGGGWRKPGAGFAKINVDAGKR